MWVLDDCRLLVELTSDLLALFVAATGELASNVRVFILDIGQSNGKALKR